MCFLANAVFDIQFKPGVLKNNFIKINCNYISQYCMTITLTNQCIKMQSVEIKIDMKKIK